MKARKDLRQAINRARARHGKKNGVLHPCFFDFGSRGPFTDKRAKKPRYPEINV